MRKVLIAIMCICLSTSAPHHQLINNGKLFACLHVNKFSIFFPRNQKTPPPHINFIFASPPKLIEINFSHASVTFFSSFLSAKGNLTPERVGGGRVGLAVVSNRNFSNNTAVSTHASHDEGHNNVKMGRKNFSPFSLPLSAFYQTRHEFFAILSIFEFSRAALGSLSLSQWRGWTADSLGMLFIKYEDNEGNYGFFSFHFHLHSAPVRAKTTRRGGKSSRGCSPRSHTESVDSVDNFITQFHSHVNRFRA